MAANVPVPDADPRAAVISSYDEAGENVLVVLSHSSVMKAAAQFAALAGLKPSDELVTFLPIAWFGDFLQFSAAIFVGALVSSVENSATVFQDLRRLAPDVLLAPVSFYRRMLARIEADIKRASPIVGWLYARSKSFEGGASGPLVQGGAGFFSHLAAWFLSIAFRAPLRNVVGLYKARAAFCAEGCLPPELEASFRGIGVELRSLDLDPRFGGILGAFGHDAQTGPARNASMDGIKLRRDAAGKSFCLSDHVAIGTIEIGGRLTPLPTGPDGWCRARLAGRIDRSGDAKFLEDTDLRDLDPEEAFSLRGHVTRLNAALPVRHTVLRKDGEMGWVAVIDPDVDFLRTLSSDPGAEYHELLEQSEILAVLAAIIKQSNEAEFARFPDFLTAASRHSLFSSGRSRRMRAALRETAA